MTDVTTADLMLDALPGDELHAVLRHAREEGPVVPVIARGLPAFLITRFSALREYLSAQEDFPGGVFYELSTRPHIGSTFINMDGPAHDTYRQLATPAFRSRATARFIDRELTPLAHEIVDRFAARGHGDLVAEFAQVMPFWSISRKLGLPIGSEEKQRRWALQLLDYPSNPEPALAAAAELTEFLRPVIDERRSVPADDVVSNLLAGEYHGTRFSDDEVYSHVRLLYAVGATTTSDGLSTLLHHLLRQPELLARVREDRSLLPRVVHESLRFDPPVANLPRIAPNGGTIAGVEIPPGSMVLCGIASANRDPEVFDDADRFDIDRDETDLLTFGFGTKFCPGSHLARQQLLCALDVILDRLPSLELVATDAPNGAILRRCERLDVTWAA
jgi:cytochrome P450